MCVVRRGGGDRNDSCREARARLSDASSVQIGADDSVCAPGAGLSAVVDGVSLDGDRGSPGLHLWAVGHRVALGRTGRVAFGNDQSGKRAWKGILASSPACSKLSAEAGARLG